MTLSDLISKLEQAEEGGRELDKFIAVFTGTVVAAYEEVHMDSRSYSVYPEDWPSYTTSIDSAVTLIPEGWTTNITLFPSGGSQAFLEKWVDHDLVGTARSWGEQFKTFPPALAVAVAALKAIRHQKDAKP